MRRFAQVQLVAVALLATSCARATRSAASGELAAAARLTWKPVSFAILEDYDVGDDLTEPARDFGLFRRLGVRTWRGSISWLEVEPERGRYDFAWLHRFARLAADSGITLRPYAAYTPAWTARGGRDRQAWNDPPRSIADWTDFVRALATALRRHPNVRSLEIYNEENTAPWWDGSEAAYDSVLAAAAAAIGATAPRLQLLLGGMVWPDAEWTAHACAATHVDIVPFHAYPETWTPESVTVENYLRTSGYASFLPVERQACGGVPVWMDEIGYATVPGRTERDQALWWTRAIATYLAVPAVQEIGIYEIKDLRPGAAAIGGSANYHLGITDTLRRPKLAFHTVQLLVRLLGTDSLAVLDPALRVQVRAGADSAVYVHAFLRPDGRQVVVLWTRRGTVSLDVRLPFAGRRAVSYALDGRAAPVADFDGRRLAFDGLRPGDVRIVEIVP